MVRAIVNPSAALLRRILQSTPDTAAFWVFRMKPKIIRCDPKTKEASCWFRLSLTQLRAEMREGCNGDACAPMRLPSPVTFGYAVRDVRHRAASVSYPHTARCGGG